MRQGIIALAFDLFAMGEVRRRRPCRPVRRCDSLMAIIPMIMKFPQPLSCFGAYSKCQAITFVLMVESSGEVDCLAGVATPLREENA